MSAYTSTVPARAAVRHVVGVPAKSPQVKGFFARLFARLMEARRRQAAFELQRHGLRLPSALEDAGYRITERNEDSLPFVR